MDLAIRNPNDPNHFMRVKPIEGLVRVWRDSTLLASTTNALTVLEVGRDIYDPVYYFPETDLQADLSPVSKSTHCPLKGDATYFDLLDSRNKPLVAEIAWSYPTPLSIARILAGHYSFYASKVRLEIIGEDAQ